MANKGGGWVFAAVLVGAIALAGSDGSSSSSASSTTSSGSSSSTTDEFTFDLTFDDQGGTCSHTTTFTSSQGKFTIPSNNSDDPVTARNCTLSADHGSGAPVNTLQKALNQCHGQHLSVDGDYGSGTTQAVRSVQGKLGLTVDGKYGPATAGAMAWPTTPDDGKTACVVHPG